MKFLNKLLNNRVFLMVLVVILLVILWKCVSTIEGMTNGEDVFSSSSVPDSTPSTFNGDLGSTPKLVWFYAPWCGHCKSMHKDWDNAAAEVNLGDNTMIKVDVGDQNNKEHTRINKQFGVNGYPTILLLNNGKKEREYNGGRTHNDFINFCKQNNLAI